MTSWRDSATEAEQIDLDGLLGPALDFAKQQLAAHGQFFPFAVAVCAAGEQEMISVDLPEPFPETSAINSSLVATLMEQRERLRAIAIVTDRLAADRESNVIAVIMEHSEGACLAIELPYTRSRRSRRSSFGSLRAIAALRSIW